jgi:hypothetical protein
MSINLYDAINSSYGDTNSIKKIEKKGYIKDNELSNHNESVFYNPQSKKLLYNVSGSHNSKDWLVTDFGLALGRLKGTSRYEEAEKVLNKAKAKYSPKETTLTGHSLSGPIINGIADKGKGDKVYSLNGAYTIGQKTRNPNGNFHNYRVEGDLVSYLGSHSKNLKTISNNDIFKRGVVGAYFAHQPRHIKKEKIYV